MEALERSERLTLSDMLLIHFNYYIFFPLPQLCLSKLLRKPQWESPDISLSCCSFPLCNIKHWQTATWFHFAVVVSHLDTQNKIKKSEEHDSAADFHWKIMCRDPKFIAYEI